MQRGTIFEYLKDGEPIIVDENENISLMFLFPSPIKLINSPYEFVDFYRTPGVDLADFFTGVLGRLNAPASFEAWKQKSILRKLLYKLSDDNQSSLL